MRWATNSSRQDQALPPVRSSSSRWTRPFSLPPRSRQMKRGVAAMNESGSDKRARGAGRPKRANGTGRLESLPRPTLPAEVKSSRAKPPPSERPKPSPANLGKKTLAMTFPTSKATRRRRSQVGKVQLRRRRRIGNGGEEVAGAGESDLVRWRAVRRLLQLRRKPRRQPRKRPLTRRRQRREH